MSDGVARAEELITAAAASHATHLDLSGLALSALPPSIGGLTHLEHLNAADNLLTDLPDELCSCTSLRVLFFLNNRFTHVPRVVGRLPLLRMLSFKSCRVAEIAEDALPPSLVWLILTDNALTRLPASLGRLSRLRKLMLASNRLEALPDMEALESLELVRLSDNHLTVLPPSLLRLPRLAWLALAGNLLSPLRRDDVVASLDGQPQALHLSCDDFELGPKLGEGASGTVFKATLHAGEEEEVVVAVKIFKAASSDGRPVDEVAAAATLPPHPSLINLVGFVKGVDRLATVLEFCDGLDVLGRPPSFATVTRDVFATTPAPALSPLLAVEIAHAAAAALAHMHASGIAHGDVYAHNLMVDARAVRGAAIDVAKAAKLGDLGAAFFYDKAVDVDGSFERIDVRGFACLVEDLIGILDATAAAGVNAEVAEGKNARAALAEIAIECGCEGGPVSARPRFADIEARLAMLL